MEAQSRTIAVNGLQMFVTEQGSGPLILLVHGWPESSHSWRHQIPALAEAGFRVVVPDMRGYGYTSAPADVADYSVFDLVGDLVDLVRVLGETQAIVVGHDWGAAVAWHAAMFRPDVFRAVAALSVPASGRGPLPPLETMRRAGFENFYWHYFQEPGIAEAEFEQDIERTMRTVLFGRVTLALAPGAGFLGDAAAPAELPAWLSADDLRVMVERFTRSGFRGGLNWYRNLDRNWRLTAPWQDAKIRQPSLFVAGKRDAVITGPIGAKRLVTMDEMLPGLTAKVLVDGAGHWIQQERPREVNEALLAFVRGLG